MLTPFAEDVNTLDLSVVNCQPADCGYTIYEVFVSGSVLYVVQETGTENETKFRHSIEKSLLLGICSEICVEIIPLYSTDNYTSMQLKLTLV